MREKGKEGRGKEKGEKREEDCSYTSIFLSQ
jgi:hypothetical protein